MAKESTMVNMPFPVGQTPSFSEDNDSYAGSSDESGVPDSTTDSSAARQSNANADSVADSIAKKDTKAAFHLRVLVIALFIFMSVFVPVVIFITARRNEEDGFKSEFDALATKVVDSFEFNVARKLGAIDSLDISITSYAVGTNSTWPYVTMPDFDLRAANTLALADTFSIVLVPIVDRLVKTKWEEYAVNNGAWVSTALSRQTISVSLGERRLQTATTVPFSTTVTSGTTGIDDSDHLFPVWQNAPVDTQIVNFDLVTHESFSDGVLAMVQTEEAVLGRVVNVDNPESNFLYDYFAKLQQTRGRSYQGEPASTLFYPIFDRFGEDHNLVAFFASTIFWHTFFEGILPSNAKGIICVIENECGQSFTYQINGQNAVYLGDGDRHDRQFDGDRKHFSISSLQQSESFTFRETSIPLNHEYCPYSLEVYPSETLQDEYITFRPILYTFCVTFAFVLISAVAITYDCVVQRRLKSVLNSALESRAIVSSLFPANVRDRLFEQDEDRLKDRAFGKPVGEEKHPDSKDHHLTAHPAKLRLKNFLHEGGKAGEFDQEQVHQAKPIADLFPHCTVLFADIAGFTAWSSEREPAQVFTLLQTIFHFFDKIARKWGVFKVETIGDCYVAVTGLPDPQPDHAIRMTKFARECLQKVTALTGKLESSLGPDTGDLCMRFGLHSGPVTAGVLRGEKSRFQLFGDTVNTASRMESSGKRNKIHISQATADLLVEAGKGSWVIPREDMVSAKGKGQIQTYWIAQKTRAVASSIGSGTEAESEDRSEAGPMNDLDADFMDAQNSRPSSKDSPMIDIPPSANVRKLKRLIDWQTEILARLLKPIVAQRGRNAKQQIISDPANAIKKGECILDEVAETLVLPKFNEDKADTNTNPNTIELSPAVMAQLREYVTIMSSRYHDNPFHNFEHASHVTMSANKLLNRIVIPEEVNYQRKNVKAIASDLHDYTYGITSDPLTQFAAIFCALIHDVDHAGVSNFQLAKEKPDLAQKYKNRGLAEQNSVDIAWGALMDPKFKDLQNCIFTNQFELQRFRQLVVNLVMATDIFDKEMKALRNSRWDKAFHPDPNAAPLSEEETTNLKATIVIEHIIQAADVAHTMQHWHVYTKWNERLFQEMYLAYEQGRSPKDPSEGWYNGELWFFDNYVIPLAKKLDECNVFGVASDEGLNYALANRAEWAVKGTEMVAEMVERYNQRKSGDQVRGLLGGMGQENNGGFKQSAVMS